MIKKIRRWFRKRHITRLLLFLIGLDDWLKEQGISRQSRRYFWRRMATEEDRNKVIKQLLKEVGNDSQGQASERLLDT